MSDFLSNLVSTALHVTPIAQPRTPALFEPRVTDADKPPLESFEAAGISPTIAPHTATRVEQHETRDQLDTILKSKSNHVVDAAMRTTARTLHAEQQPSTIATPGVAQSIPRPVTVPLPKIEAPGREEQSERADTAHHMLGETSTPVSTSPLTPHASPIETIHPRIERQARDVQVERDTIEPRIHISIGRIEVRAATASAPTRAPKREASILGLDEFLRQRR